MLCVRWLLSLEVIAPEPAAGPQSPVPVKRQQPGLVPAELSTDKSVAEFYADCSRCRAAVGAIRSRLVPWICDRLPSVSRRVYFRDLATFIRHLRAVGVDPLAVTTDDIRFYKVAIQQGAAREYEPFSTRRN